MNKINSYKDLLVWQKAIDISFEVYRLTRLHFPNDEIFGLTSQVRRAANSISLNIAEGYGKLTTKNYINFLVTAYSSNNELESGFILAEKLEFVKEKELENLFSMISEESKMLNSLIGKLNIKNDK
ncbi:MAG: four helix bundle protein [Bacteroidota bacterium]